MQPRCQRAEVTLWVSALRSSRLTYGVESLPATVVSEIYRRASRTGSGMRVTYENGLQTAATGYLGNAHGQSAWKSIYPERKTSSTSLCGAGTLARRF